MSIELYPNIAKVKRNGVYQNLPGFVQASGDADIKAMIANSENSTTAQYAHTEGSYFILNDVLYKAIINIAVNDTIAVGTNCEVAILSDDVSKFGKITERTDNDFNAFAYSTKYLTQFPAGTYKWYPLTLANGTVLKLKTLDGSNYANNELLLYNSYLGTQLGTIYPTVNGDSATYTVDKDNVTYIRTGANFSQAVDVYEVVNGFDAETKINRLIETAKESITDIKHIFEFEFGDVNGSGQVVVSQRRMTTPTIQHYDYNIIIPKRNGYTGCGIVTYSDATGSSPQFLGVVNSLHDYLIKAGTYFRLIIYNPDNTQIVTGDKYNNLIYNDFHAYSQPLSNSYIRSGNYKDTYLYNKNVKSVCHRGASRTAPENTLPAFIVARKYGFEWVETDIAWTHDNVPVLLHDETINRTSNGTGNIADLDYDDIKNLDFGSWFSPSYAGTKIPTLEEFLALCRKIGLKARLDMNHSMNQSQYEEMCRLVIRYGMKNNVEFNGYSVSSLEYIKDILPSATLILTTASITSQIIEDISAVKTDTNEIHFATQTINDTIVDLCVTAQIPVEYWTAGTDTAIKNLDPYVTVVTVEDTYDGQPLVAGYILYESVIN